MTLADDTRSLLLAIRLGAVSEAEGLRATLALMGLAVDDLESLASRLELAGLIEHRTGARPGWRLTADGRAEGERLLGDELDRLDVREAVMNAYERFLALNGTLLRVCTDWQLRDANPSALVVNDHSDPEYDGAVIDRLGSLHAGVLPVCSDLTASLPRFAGYGPRFTVAIDRVTAGDLDGFAQPDTDSYHSIWFELHDHLLATVGIDRADEPLPPPANAPLPPT